MENNILEVYPVSNVDCLFLYFVDGTVFIVSPCKTTTIPKQVHKGHANEAVHIQDQVGFLIQQNHTWKKMSCHFTNGARHCLVKAVNDRMK